MLRLREQRLGLDRRVRISVPLCPLLAVAKLLAMYWPSSARLAVWMPSLAVNVPTLFAAVRGIAERLEGSECNVAEVDLILAAEAGHPSGKTLRLVELQCAGGRRKGHVRRRVERVGSSVWPAVIVNSGLAR